MTCYTNIKIKSSKDIIQGISKLDYLYKVSSFQEVKFSRDDAEQDLRSCTMRFYFLHLFCKCARRPKDQVSIIQQEETKSLIKDIVNQQSQSVNRSVRILTVSRGNSSPNMVETRNVSVQRKKKRSSNTVSSSVLGMTKERKNTTGTSKVSSNSH